MAAILFPQFVNITLLPHLCRYLARNFRARDNQQLPLAWFKKIACRQFMAKINIDFENIHNKNMIQGWYSLSRKLPYDQFQGAVSLLWKDLVGFIWMLLKTIELYLSYMRHQPRPSLLQIMACRLFGAKPLSEPMLPYCQL